MKKYKILLCYEGDPSIKEVDAESKEEAIEEYISQYYPFSHNEKVVIVREMIDNMNQQISNTLPTFYSDYLPNCQYWFIEEHEIGVSQTLDLIDELEKISNEDCTCKENPECRSCNATQKLDDLYDIICNYLEDL